MSKLEWGQTPWDNKQAPELLRDVQRMYQAIIALNSCLSMSKHSGPNHPYFGADGSGGRALEMARQILDPIHAEYEAEDIYRSFFRYADDLLFDQTTGVETGFGWVVCPVCGVMLGGAHDGEPCGNKAWRKDCPGVFRELTWEDLRPK